MVNRFHHFDGEVSFIGKLMSNFGCYFIFYNFLYYGSEFFFQLMRRFGLRLKYINLWARISHVLIWILLLNFRLKCHSFVFLIGLLILIDNINLLFLIHLLLWKRVRINRTVIYFRPTQIQLVRHHTFGNHLYLDRSLILLIGLLEFG